MIIEDMLLNYGILGLWTLTLLAEKYKFNKEMKKIIEDNTKALIKIETKLK